MPGARILLPRIFLRRWLERSGGTPLEPEIRDFMEARFGTTLADVRIHVGPAAASLCDALQARALTLGSDIVFGCGHYAPQTPEGRRLLAHELVHVLQQRAATVVAWRVTPEAFARLVNVGDPDDACEREAARLADEALAGGLRSGVTPDASGVMRRTL
ncbi:MAG: DUF4157 domain-containing protein [Alphaproteobacteria bacterium]|nr:DUF4157 domain-containing protein [Alphaproteobacteria bacterium]